MRLTQKAIPFPKIGRWRIEFEFGPAFHRMGAFRFRLGVYKPRSWPPEGEVLTTKHYKGFYISKDFSFLAVGFAWNMPKGTTLAYKLSRPADEKTIEACDEGFKAFRWILHYTARQIGGPVAQAWVWLLSRIYRRQILEDRIAYHLPLMWGGEEKVGALPQGPDESETSNW